LDGVLSDSIALAGIVGFVDTEAFGEGVFEASHG
jgi:hypothetical protein